MESRGTEGGLCTRGTLRGDGVRGGLGIGVSPLGDRSLLRPACSRSPLLMQYPAASCPSLRRALVAGCLGPLAVLLSAAANPVLNEIFYHEDHGAGPENPLKWIAWPFPMFWDRSLAQNLAIWAPVQSYSLQWPQW